MKKITKIILVIILLAAGGGFTYWQINKKKIIKQSIQNAITKKTDSLYYLHYDSSNIDELNGNASFYNVVLQSDSAQKQLLKSTDSLPNALYNVRIQEVAANGIDIPGLLQKRNVTAKKIILVKPLIQIINTGADNPKTFSKNDTLALYQKILGNFKSINADSIRIINGTLLITNKSGKVQTTLENINVSLGKFLVDSTKDYNSMVSYFIKDIRVTVENVQLPASKNGNRINFEKIDYNAAGKYLHIAGIQQYQANNIKPVIDLKNILVNGLNTDAFILQEQLKAGQVDCAGGVITIYVSKKAKAGKSSGQSIEMSTDIIDQAQLAGINLGNTRIIIADKDQPSKPPFILSNTRFKATKILKIEEGTSIKNLINNAEWELSADGFSFDTKDKLYKVSMGSFTVNNTTASARIKNFALTPLLTEKQYVSQSKFQHDQYNLRANDIALSGINIKKFVTDNELEVDKASFQPIIKIFNDRTLPPDKSSQLGKYPHENFVKTAFPVYINTIKINKGLVSYRERAEDSKLIGNVFFSGVDATIFNLTNIPAHLKADDLLKLKATAKFLGAGNLSTEWQLKLNATNGKFKITGELQAMKAVTLNSIIEPLSLASANKGNIDKVTFRLDGTDTNAIGNILVLYRDLKMTVLKKGSDSTLKKRGLMSLIASLLLKKENVKPENNKIVDYKRDTTRSFFNLVWKTIFTGAKNTALGKK